MRLNSLLKTLAAVCLVACCGHVNAQIIDGQLDSMFYGPALSIQNTDTQFGDAGLPDVIDSGGGSEIDQVFARVDNGRLYVMVAGNLERNFNKLEVFIDSETGGSNQLDGAQLARWC